MDVWLLARQGDINGVQDLLMQGMAGVNDVDNQGRSLVHYAVENEDEQLLSWLVEQPGINLNIKDDFGATPLFLAVNNGFKGLALILAENGADIDADGDAAAPEDAFFDGEAAELQDEFSQFLDDDDGAAAPVQAEDFDWEQELGVMDQFLDEGEQQVEQPVDHVADGLDDVDGLIGDLQREEGSRLADSTDLIVNWDSVTNCLIDYICTYAKSSLERLTPEEAVDFVSLAQYLNDEVLDNHEKFPFWLDTLENENIVTLHANRNQVKGSCEQLVTAVSEFNASGDANATRSLLTKTQTAVGDCWNFYLNTSDPWKYEHVIFSHIEEVVKISKRLLMAAKCESGEDWITICLLSANAALQMGRVVNYASFQKRNCELQIEINQCTILISKVLKRIMQTGDNHRQVPTAKTKHYLGDLQKALINQIRTLHAKMRVPPSAARPVVYTQEILAALAKGYKGSSKQVLDAIDNYSNMFGSSFDVDVQELIELGEFISRGMGKMAQLFRAIPLELVNNVVNIAFNVSKLARIVVKWAGLPQTHELTRDLLLSTMQTALNYSIQAKVITSLKACSYPIVEIESATFTAVRGLADAIANLYDACCFLDLGDEVSQQPLSDDPNAVAHATALCLHFGRPTPVEKVAPMEDQLGMEGLMDGEPDPESTDLDTLNADDLLDSVDDLLADTASSRRSTVSAVDDQPAAAAEPDYDEEEFPELEPLPAQPPALTDIEGYKAYMKLKYEHQQRENAILLRQMKREQG